MMDFLIQKAYAALPNEGMGSTGIPNEGISFDQLLQRILDNIVNPIILLLMASAVVYFLYGVAVFIQNADNPDKRQEGYQHMFWGIVGIFIMISASGLVRLIGSTVQ